MQNHQKRPWTRSEKWLIVAPVFLLLCAFGMTSGKEMLRRQMGWPKKVIAVPDLSAKRNQLHLFAVSNDGKIVVNRGQENPLYVFDIESGEILNRLTLNNQATKNGSLYQCHFLPDQQKLIIGSMLPLVWEIWDIPTSRLLRPLLAKSLTAAISPDGHFLATGRYELWELSSIRLKKKLLRGGTDRPVKFSLNGKLLAIRGPADVDKDGNWTGGQVWIWNVPSGRLLQKIPTQMASNYGFSPNGEKIVCLEENLTKGFGVKEHNLMLFDLQSGRKVWSYAANISEAGWRDLAFSNDGRWVAVSTWKDTIQLRRADTGALVTLLQRGWRDSDVDNSSMSPPNIIFTRDGKFLVLRARHEIRIWDMNEVNARFAPDK